MQRVLGFMNEKLEDQGTYILHCDIKFQYVYLKVSQIGLWNKQTLLL